MIRSIGTWNLYKKEAHTFVKFLQAAGVRDLRDVDSVQKLAASYLAQKLTKAREGGQSIRTQETCSSALAAFEKSFNKFFAQRDMPDRLSFSAARREYLALSREYLQSGREYAGGTRAYPYPERLVSAIQNETHRLQATLQYEGGLRAEGAGAPSGRVGNPLTKDNLKGLMKDRVTGADVGAVEVKEKGGKWTVHYVPQQTYEKLASYLEKHGSLQSRYRDYRNAVIAAAKASGQHSSGRGTHGLKTCFAQRRYAECVRHGLSHEQAMQITALELSHNRSEITMIYTKG